MLFHEPTTIPEELLQKQFADWEDPLAYGLESSLLLTLYSIQIQDSLNTSHYTNTRYSVEELLENNIIGNFSFPTKGKES